jgi:hypothetical protein
MIDPVLNVGAPEPDVCVAYALTSRGDDTYLRMTALSAQSVLLAMPKCRVVVAMDGQTAREASEAIRAALPSSVELLMIKTPEGTPVWRNRFVKSSLRGRLVGPFIYLDADTLVRRDLSVAYDWDFDVAAVSNHNTAKCDIPGNEREVFHRCGWAVPTVAYCNAGVQFWRDTPKTRDLARLYHEGWLHVATTTGRAQDQQAFNHALDQSEAKVTVLPDEFNSQINSAPQTAFDAHLWHYFESDKLVVAVPRTHFGEALSNIATVDISAIVNVPHPWVVANKLDGFAVRSFRSNTDRLGHGDWRRLWLSGDRTALIRYHFWSFFRMLRKAGRFTKESLRV